MLFSIKPFGQQRCHHRDQPRPSQQPMQINRLPRYGNRHRRVMHHRCTIVRFPPINRRHVVVRNKYNCEINERCDPNGMTRYLPFFIVKYKYMYIILYLGCVDIKPLTRNQFAFKCISLSHVQRKMHLHSRVLSV